MGFSKAAALTLKNVTEVNKHVSKNNDLSLTLAPIYIDKPYPLLQLIKDAFGGG